VQRSNREEPNEDGSKREPDVENELLNQVGVENDDARKKSEQPHCRRYDVFEYGLRIEQIPPGF
jgi:thiaminase